MMNDADGRRLMENAEVARKPGANALRLIGNDADGRRGDSWTGIRLAGAHRLARSGWLDRLPVSNFIGLKFLGSTMATVTVQISNSDNKLPQDRWARFCAEMRDVIRSRADSVYFEGGSKWDAPSQNACWVCEARAEQIEGLKSAIAACRKQFEQDSAAVTVGDPQFV